MIDEWWNLHHACELWLQGNEYWLRAFHYKNLVSAAVLLHARRLLAEVGITDPSDREVVEVAKIFCELTSITPSSIRDRLKRDIRQMWAEPSPRP